MRLLTPRTSSPLSLPARPDPLLVAFQQRNVDINQNSKVPVLFYLLLLLPLSPSLGISLLPLLNHCR